MDPKRLVVTLTPEGAERTYGIAGDIEAMGVAVESAIPGMRAIYLAGGAGRIDEIRSLPGVSAVEEDGAAPDDGDAD